MATSFPGVPQVVFALTSPATAKALAQALRHEDEEDEGGGLAGHMATTLANLKEVSASEGLHTHVTDRCEPSSLSGRDVRPLILWCVISGCGGGPLESHARQGPHRARL